MPQKQDQSGWQPPSEFKLRKGQQQVIDLLADSQSAPRKNGQLIAELPTGYGKTVVVCASYALLRAAGVANRMLVIVPSNEQFESYLTEIESDMTELGAPVSGALKAASTLSLKAHRTNQAEIFVTTVQTLTGNEDAITDLLATGRWLVAADEFHRYAKSNTWGGCICRLNSVFTLAVSATPDRTDKAEKAITGEPDVRLTLKEAVDEGAIRPVVVRASDYAVDITLNGDSTPRRLSTAELAKELAESGADISAQEVKKDLRYYSKYLYKATLDALGRLNELNSIPGQEDQHKMLVFSMGVGHAKSVCEQFNDLAGVKIADWIGVQSTVVKSDGSTVTIGRSEVENENVLRRFKAGDFNVLVQVKKATEGFNDVRCSVLLFLNLTGETVLLKQMIGRGLRRNYVVEPSTGCRAAVDRCWIYVSNDHPGLEYMKRLEGDMAEPDDEDGDDPDKVHRDPPADPIYGIPEFYILDAQFSGEELFYPFGNEQVSVETAVQKARDGVPALANASNEDVQSALRKLFGMEPRPVSTAERIGAARKKIVAVVNTLAGNVVRIRAARCAGTFPKSLLGDTIRAIHARWMLENPNLSHENMTVEELVLKHDWVRKVNNGMKEAPDAYAYIVSEAPWLLL